MNYNGVSIVTVTKRKDCISNIYNNFHIQNFKNKELIIVINNDDIDVDSHYEYLELYKNVFIYTKPQNISLGECLNYGISKAHYDIIAKFDDDDYYGQYYLNEAINILSSGICDVVGKTKTYYYLEKYNSLFLNNKGFENQYSQFIMGSTLCFKKSIFDNIKFRDVRYREDYLFNMDCIENNLKIYSSSCNNHIVYKFADNKMHTWQCDIDYLIKHCSLIKSDIEFNQCFSFTDKKIN